VILHVILVNDFRFDDVISGLSQRWSDRSKWESAERSYAVDHDSTLIHVHVFRFDDVISGSI